MALWREIGFRDSLATENAIIEYKTLYRDEEIQYDSTVQNSIKFKTEKEVCAKYDGTNIIWNTESGIGSTQNKIRTVDTPTTKILWHRNLPSSACSLS